MTLVVVIPKRGELRHPLQADTESVCRIVTRLAPVVPAGAVWTVAP